MEYLRDQIKVVIEARERARNANLLKVAEYNKWVEANQHLYDYETATKLECNEAEGRLRELTLQAYAETGNKAPMLGVGIREVTKLEYDTKEAFAWAVEHKMAIKLDTSAFEKIAKLSPPEFVTVFQEPQATIATQLQLE